MSDAPIMEALLALIAALVGAMIWALKLMITRSDARSLEQSEYQSQLIKSLTTAVELFGRLEEEEREAHTAMAIQSHAALASQQQSHRELLQTQHDILQVQAELAEAISSLHQKFDTTLSSRRQKNEAGN